MLDRSGVYSSFLKDPPPDRDQTPPGPRTPTPPDLITPGQPNQNMAVNQLPANNFE